jgi:hypothetical protein
MRLQVHMPRLLHHMSAMNTHQKETAVSNLPRDLMLYLRPMLLGALTVYTLWALFVLLVWWVW